MAARIELHPHPARAVILGLVGVVTAAAPFTFAQPSLASAISHLAMGGAILAAGLWRCWRPLVKVSGGVLLHGSRWSRKRTSLRLSEVVSQLRPTPTGHSFSERDLASQLGVRVRGGGFHWIDLSELRLSDRLRVREIIGGATPPDASESTSASAVHS